MVYYSRFRVQVYVRAPYVLRLTLEEERENTVHTVLCAACGVVWCGVVVLCGCVAV